jgi:hypothetical protein
MIVGVLVGVSVNSLGEIVEVFVGVGRETSTGKVC